MTKVDYDGILHFDTDDFQGPTVHLSGPLSRVHVRTCSHCFEQEHVCECEPEPCS